MPDLKTQIIETLVAARKLIVSLAGEDMHASVDGVIRRVVRPEIARIDLCLAAIAAGLETKREPGRGEDMAPCDASEIPLPETASTSWDAVFDDPRAELEYESLRASAAERSNKI
jgi:hypothetical protein